MVRRAISLRHLGLMLLLAVSGAPGCGTEDGDGWTGTGGGTGGGVGGGTGGGVGGATGGGAGADGGGGAGADAGAGAGDAGADILDGGLPATCAPAAPAPGVYVLQLTSEDESCAPSLFATVKIGSVGEIAFVSQNVEVLEVCSDSFAFRLYGANPSEYVDYSGPIDWSYSFSGPFEATGHEPGNGPDCSTTATFTMNWLIID